MAGYVNHQAMVEVFSPLEQQRDPTIRATLIHLIQDEYTQRLVEMLERTAFELKENGWTVPQVADELSLTVAQTRRAILQYARRAGRISPLRDKGMAQVIDIRSLVRKADENRPAGEGTTHPTA